MHMEAPKPRTRNTVVPEQLYVWNAKALEREDSRNGTETDGVVGSDERAAEIHFREHYPLPKYPILTLTKLRPYSLKRGDWRIGYDPVTGLKIV